VAGYILTFNNFDSLLESASLGVYSTRLKIPGKMVNHEGTFADFATMKAGDNIYFFHKRNIYGIATLKNIDDDCKFLNFSKANDFSREFRLDDIANEVLFANERNWRCNFENNKRKEDDRELRWVCTFEPSYGIFKNGIDMDAALQSNPHAFKMLRAFEKLSFIKIDDEENQALKEVLLKRNLNIATNKLSENKIEDKSKEIHKKIKKKLTNIQKYKFNPKELLLSSVIPNKNLLKRESTLEAALLYQLSTNDDETVEVFGEWDYLSHQVVASPFKPIIWMDKMDIFGYRYIEDNAPITSMYFVAELKKEKAEIMNVDQLLKYVDWINNEYTIGDYSRIKAFLVASDFTDEAKNHVKQFGIRKYTTSLRDNRASDEWSDLTLVRYRYNPEKEKLDFEIVQV